MKQHPAFKSTTRVCAICGKALRKLAEWLGRYGFRGVLARNGIKGDKAHPTCVRELGSSANVAAARAATCPRSS